MSTPPITATPPPAPGDIVHAGSKKNAGKTNLDSADFMKLMITQLTAQDPMNPMKDTEFISQMANFSSLENSRTLSESFKNFTSQQAMASAPNYMGKYVTVKDVGGPMGVVSGIVDGVVLDSEKPSVVIGGKRYETNLITAIGTPPVATPPTPPTGS